MSRIILGNKRSIFALPIEDIVYMEKSLRKICIHVRRRNNSLKGHSEEAYEYMDVEFYGSFTQVMPYLDNRFMYCHRSYIINMDAIVWMCGCEIYIDTNETIHMGRDTYGRARKIFTNYLNEKYPEKTLKNTNFFL